MKRIVITGGGGYLAGHLCRHLDALGNYELTLIGRSAREDRKILCADIADWEPTWTATFKGAHAVVHLAAQRAQGASWAELQRTNIDGTLNVFEAAARGQARRIIFASTSWVLGGYLKSRIKLTTDLKPRPTGPYAVSKMVGESIARHFAARHGLPAVCFRIGSCHEGEEAPDAKDLGRQHKWLSVRDFCQAMERAIKAEGIGFSLFHLTSDIEGSPWDIGETKRVLGYTPQDRYRPKPPPLVARLIRLSERKLRRA